MNASRGLLIRARLDSRMLKKRDSNIEAYRCFLMFGIVALHCAYVTLGSFTWENNIWKWCVDGFAFISGYCCIRQFSLKKVFRLYLQALFCLVMMETFNVVFNGVSFAWGVRVWRVFCDLWFLHAYVFLMAVAPLINLAAASEQRLKLLMPLLGMVFLWGMCCELPFVGAVMPKISGIQSFSGLTLAGAYAAGRLYNVYGCNEKIKLWWVIVAMPILLLAFCFGIQHRGEWVSGWLGNYISPLTLLMTACGFYVFSRIRFPGIMGKVILFIAPSMFSVYVIHSHPLWWEWMRGKGVSLVNMYPAFPVLLALALVVFLGSVACDLVRRSIFGCVDRIVRRDEDRV